MSGPTVIHASLEDREVSQTDRLVIGHLTLIQLASAAPEIALRAVIRIAGNELAKLIGFEAVGQLFSNLAYRFAERAKRIPGNARRRT